MSVQNPFFMRIFIVLSFLIVTVLVKAQSPAQERLLTHEQKKNKQFNSFFRGLPTKSIGPDIFSCRVTDLEADPSDPTRFFVAYSSGGLWYTENNGITFTPLFDHESSMTIGDIAIDWERETIWVGTGENNSSRSSYAGTGVFVSTDFGKTWKNTGLHESHHIGRVVLPKNKPSTVLVGVIGHLYSKNPERGVYKSTDGGQTWRQTLFINDSTGVIDLIADPSNPEVYYAAAWQRQRKAWHFDGAGEGSGIYKSMDGGDTWQLLSTPNSGFSFGKFTGRIGLAAGLKSGKTILYACVDNQTPRPKKTDSAVSGPSQKELSKEDFAKMTPEQFMKLDNEDLSKYLSDNEFPKDYTPSVVKNLVKSGKITPSALADYLENANSRLFEVDYQGAEVYRSEDGGLSWKKTHSEPLELMNFSYGYYFSNIRCLENNADQVYLLGYLILSSENGGTTWQNINGDNVHVDHHALWLNERRPGHLINGNDGGINMSYDNGKSWSRLNNAAVGQFYTVAVDSAKDYRVYGGTQDNGVWVGPNDFSASTDWQMTGKYAYQELMGGDGMQVAVDPRDNETVITGYQFGHYYRLKASNPDEAKLIKPQHRLGERPLRFNWQSPIHLSRHNPNILYFGANKLFRSFDQGDTWTAISEDLTRGERIGNVAFGTLTSISESPHRFGQLYVGSDDGLVHFSPDGGYSWTRISENLPQNLWVSRILASRHQPNRVYLALNGYRNDDFSPYLYVSNDKGANWTTLGDNLPKEPINVVLEDAQNPDLIFVGTDGGLYLSLDGGKYFEILDSALPAVAVHDLALQERAKDLIVATHGRSLYKIHISPLQTLTKDILQKEIYTFALREVKYSSRWGKKVPYKETKQPTLDVMLFVKNAGLASYTLTSPEGILIHSGTFATTKGINSLPIELIISEKEAKKLHESKEKSEKNKPSPMPSKSESGHFYLQKGKYLLTFKQNGAESSETLVIF